MKRICLVFAAILAACSLQAQEDVEIAGTIWATRNVGEPGTFVDSSGDFGNRYEFHYAQTVCPEGWRLPTKAELDTLRLHSEWTTVGGVNGRRFGTGDHTIFLPAAGYYASGHGFSGVYGQGNSGQYWSSSLYPEDDDARDGWSLVFAANGSIFLNQDHYYSWLNVRCVEE